MKRQDMDTHLTVLGWLYLIGNAMILMIGVVGWVFFTGIGFFAAADSGDPIALSILGVIGTAGLLFFGILALPGMVAGYGLLKRYSWARYLALVVGFLGLFNIPLGTAIGIYTFLVLLQDDSSVYFNTAKAA
jgi:hypothetical protein